MASGSIRTGNSKPDVHSFHDTKPSSSTYRHIQDEEKQNKIIFFQETSSSALPCALQLTAYLIICDATDSPSNLAFAQLLPAAYVLVVNCLKNGGKSPQTLLGTSSRSRILPPP
jgi:hypothetical protein